VNGGSCFLVKSPVFRGFMKKIQMNYEKKLKNTKKFLKKLLTNRTI